MIWDFFILFSSQENSWDRVKTTRIEWVATYNPLDCQPPPFEGAVFIDSLIPIMGTGRIKTTGVGGQDW
jgi:hypothetical protein